MRKGPSEIFSRGIIAYTVAVNSLVAMFINYPRSYQNHPKHQHMEKLVQQQQQQRDMELMKTAMLKHEETFRQQVHDLHRLYRIQRQLMSDLARRPPTVLLPCQHGQRHRHQSRRSELPVDEHIVGGGASCTGRRQVAPPYRESEDEPQLTLTLAVGSGGDRRQRMRRESTPSSSTDSTGALRAVQHRQGATVCDLREGVTAKQPQWLLHCLSLRMA